MVKKEKKILKTKVFGKKIENIYGVDHKWKSIKDENGEDKTVYTDKPTLTRESKVKEWVELCSYKGEPRYNSNRSYFMYNSVNISEDETVMIEEEIFRADLNEMHLHTNKIVETIEVDKDDMIETCKCQIEAFNKMMIESNNKLMAYCDLHKLVYEDTDAIELFKLVFPDEEYVIEDGVMKVKEKVKVNAVYADSNLYRVIDNASVISGTISCGHVHACDTAIITTR